MEQENMSPTAPTPEVPPMAEPAAEPKPEPTMETSKPESTARKLYRDTEHAWISGVCAGIAKHFNTDVVLVRLLTIAFAFLTGGGVIPLIYVIMAFAIPAEPLAAGKVSMERKWIVWLLVILLLAPFIMAILSLFILIPTALVNAVMR